MRERKNKEVRNRYNLGANPNEEKKVIKQSNKEEERPGKDLQIAGINKTKVILKVEKEGILKSSEKILKEKMKIQQLQS